MYKYIQICNEQYIYIGEKVISTNGIRKEIINNNIKMKNTKYKMNKKNIAYIVKRDKA